MPEPADTAASGADHLALAAPELAGTLEAVARAGPDQLARLLEAIASVRSEVDLPAMLRRIVETATHLVDARYGALGVLDDSGRRLVNFITTGIDQETYDRIGHVPEGLGILGLLIVDPRPLRLANLHDHPDSHGWPPAHPDMTTFLGVPVRVREQVFGNLYLCDKHDGAPFSELDERQVIALAATAGAAIEMARLHGKLREMGLLADRERIARDLHDTVIQRIFATGLTLQSMATRFTDPEVTARLQRCIDDLDDTVRHIRTTIFELQAPMLPGRSLRQEVLAMAAGTGDILGFDPVVDFSGPVDLAVSDRVAGHLMATVREALTNAVKHAKTATLEVELRVVGDELHLSVRDQGRGLPERLRPGGQGVNNMRARAEELGGRMTLANRPHGGASLEWIVPLDRSDSPNYGGRAPADGSLR